MYWGRDDDFYEDEKPKADPAVEATSLRVEQERYQAERRERIVRNSEIRHVSTEKMMAVEQKYLTGGSDHFGVNAEFLTEEGSAFVSRKLGVELLQGVCRVVSVEDANADPEVKNHPAAFFDYASPRRSLTDLETLAVECLKAESTDPALRAALLDEAMVTTQEADLPVTRDWLSRMACFQFPSDGEIVLAEQVATAFIPGSVYFLFRRGEEEAFGWGMKAVTGRANFSSTPTRRKVFAFCLAVGINLMERS